MELERLDVPRPAWPSGPVPAALSIFASWALGLAAGLAGILGLQALGAGTADLWGIVAAPVGIVAGAALVELLWPARIVVRRDGDVVRAGRLRLPAGVGEVEVARTTAAGVEAFAVRWFGPGGEVRPCATGADPAVMDAYAEGLGLVGGYAVRWRGRRPAPRAADPVALSRAVRLTRPAPGKVAVRPRGPGWRELLLGSLVLWAGTGLAVAVAYPFAPGPLGFGATLFAWEGASTLLLLTYVAAPVVAGLELVASPAGLTRIRRLLGRLAARRRQLAPESVVAISLTRRNRWQLFAATPDGPVGLGRYTLRGDAEGVRAIVLAALAGEPLPLRDP